MINNYSNQRDRNNARESLVSPYETHPRPVPSKETELKEYYITIDSRDRDRVAWPSANNFQVKLNAENTYTGATIGRSFKNVRAIEIVSVQFPNVNNILDEMYLYLCFPEVDGVYESTNLTGTKALAKLIPSTLIGNYVYIEFKKKTPRRLYKNRGQRLDRLTPEFRRYDGTLFNFGTDTTPPLAFNSKLQTSITLRIIVEVSCNL